MDAHADASANEMDESPVAQADEGLAPGVPGNHEPARAIAWRRHGTDGFLGRRMSSGHAAAHRRGA